ncbi:hypothetical protein LSPH24S_02743 [Lysinibacillus sphaericus]
MQKKIPFSTYAVIGTMLFGLYFGAGNLIFPIQLGQLAGTNFWFALVGFLVTAIGLPFLGILAIGLSGSNGLRDLASRIHPLFGVIFSLALYLTIPALSLRFQERQQCHLSLVLNRILMRNIQPCYLRCLALYFLPLSIISR